MQLFFNEMDYFVKAEQGNQTETVEKII